MKKLIALFVLLNVGDLALTQYMIVSEKPVAEANPIIDNLKDYGWGWVWLFKFAAMSVILGFLYKFFKRERIERILQVVCFLFMLFLSYMLVLSIFVDRFGVVS